MTNPCDEMRRSSFENEANRNNMTRKRCRESGLWRYNNHGSGIHLASNKLVTFYQSPKSPLTQLFFYGTVIPLPATLSRVRNHSNCKSSPGPLNTHFVHLFFCGIVFSE